MTLVDKINSHKLANKDMKILYIGQYTEGATSKMRADTINNIVKPDIFHIIDTNIPFYKTNRLWRSFGFRYKKGILIKNINKYIINRLNDLNIKNYDLIWVDKAVFITRETTERIKNHAGKLIHYTPDPAFTFHISNHFSGSLPLYDFAITTKLYELEHYKKYIPEDNIIYTTQGYNKDLHKPFISFNDKKEGVLFIGHYEKERDYIILELLKNNIYVSVAGIKWKKFISKNKNYKNLIFIGEGIYGTDYAKTISEYQFSWGALSKWIPEKHTTRTFEIPACGTALITERNSETLSFFNEDEVIFYDTVEEMIKKIRYYLSNPNELKMLTNKGSERVKKDGRDYNSIITNVLNQTKII